MSDIAFISFEQRQDNLDLFCPFCGTPSLKGDVINACEHLVLSHLNIAEEPYLYASANIQKGINSDMDIEEAIALIEKTPATGTYIGLCENDLNTHSQFVTVFDSLG